MLALTGSAVARIDWNINRDNHLSLRYNMLYADADDSGNSLQAFKFRGAEPETRPSASEGRIPKNNARIAQVPS